MLFLRYLLCLALSAGLALAQPQGGRRTGGGGGEGKIKPTQVPFFILDNPGTPCWKAIEDDEESQEIPLLTGHWGTICESEDENKHICLMSKADFKAGLEEKADFGVNDVDLYDEHKESFHSKTVECKIALEKLEEHTKRQEQREKKRKQRGRSVVFFRLDADDEDATCVAKKSELIFPNGLEVGLRQDEVKSCDDPPICILAREHTLKIFQANPVTEDNLVPLWNEYHNEFTTEDPVEYSWKQYKMRGC